MGANMSQQTLGCLQPEACDRDWIQDSSEEEGTAEQMCDCAQRSDTLIIFDWDDTLLCSTALRTMTVSQGELHRLERRIKRILTTAMSLAETLIVTNGNRTWVQDSAKNFMPGLLPLLSQLEVVSARALFEEAYPDDPFMWKRAAFEHLLMDVRHFPENPGLNLVVLGDQFPEINAAQYVAMKRRGNTLVKAVKFVEQPSTAELIGQLGLADRCLSSLVDEQGEGGFRSGVSCRHLVPVEGRPIWRASAWHYREELDRKSVSKEGTAVRAGNPSAATAAHVAKGLKEIYQLFL